MRLILAFALLAFSARAAFGQAPPRRPLRSPPRADFTITATEYRLTLPSTVSAGWRTVRLRSAGREFHHAVFLRLPNARAADSALAALAAWTGDKDRIVPGTTSVGGVEGADPEAASRGEPHAPDTYGVVALEPGYYLVLCMIPTAAGVLHVNRGMHAMLHVVAARPGARHGSPPVADLTVRTSDYAYRLSAARVTRGWNLIAVVNDGPAEHVTEIGRLRAGRHLANLLRREPEDPIAAVVGGVPRIAAGARGYAWVRLEPGSYILQCPLQTASGWRHAERGMLAEITVE